MTDINFGERWSKKLLIVICLASFALMLGASFAESAIVDELAHIPAGYAYVRFLDYRINPEHPPLLKALAAAPLILLRPQFPLDNPWWTSAVNGEWAVGGAFLYGLKNDAETLIRTARLVPMLATILLVVLVYQWSKRIMGKGWALLPATLTAFSPVILAHGHYDTTDIAAALGAIVGLYSFEHFIEDPSWKTLIWAGLGFGFAQVMKFSLVLLFPVYILLALLFVAAEIMENLQETHRARWKLFWERLWRVLAQVVLIFVIGIVVVVYPLYALFTARYPMDKQIADTEATIGYLADTKSNGPEELIARADLWAVRHQLTRPLAQYGLGLVMVMQRVSGTDQSYFLGQVFDRGKHSYFPVIYALKETIPALILILAGIALAVTRAGRNLLRRRFRLPSYILDHFAEFAMLIFVGFYWIWSITSPLNIGVRHLIPTLPLIYILTAVSLSKWAEKNNGWLQNRYKIGGILVLLLWLGIEIGLVYPHYISYYNEFAGGTTNGYRSATDSNYDWGQDMLALQRWTEKHPEVDKLALDFFGASNPTYYLGNKFVAWQSSKGDPRGQGIRWFAVSISKLQLAIQPTSGFERPEADSYKWLTDIRAKEPGVGGVPIPDQRVGTSIFIYKLE